MPEEVPVTVSKEDYDRICTLAEEAGESPEEFSRKLLSKCLTGPITLFHASVRYQNRFGDGEDTYVSRDPQEVYEGIWNSGAQNIWDSDTRYEDMSDSEVATVKEALEEEDYQTAVQVMDDYATQGAFNNYHYTIEQDQL